MTDYPEIKNGEDLAKFFDAMPIADPNAEHGFDMQFQVPSDKTDHPCGSAMGIGGWVAFLRPYDLCFDADAIVSSATPQQAAQAIRNTMEFNDPKWEEIL